MCVYISTCIRFDRFDYVNDSIDFRFLQLVGDAYQHGDESSGVSDEMDAAIEDEAWPWVDKHETDAGENWHEHGWGTDGGDWWSDNATPQYESAAFNTSDEKWGDCPRFDRSDFLQIVNHHRSIRSIVTYIYTHIYICTYICVCT